MPMVATNALSLNVRSGTRALRMIVISAESAMMYGITLVTTARLTSTENCSDKVGEIVESAMTVCTTAMKIMPTTGAVIALVLAKNCGKKRSCAADFAVCPIVNCQPSSEPRQAITASARMIEPTVGLNICAYASANGPVDLARSAFGMMPWIT